MNMLLFCAEGGVRAVRTLRITLFLLIVVGFTAGCSTATSRAPAADRAAVANENAADSSNPARVLKKGLRADEVKSLLGDPRKVEPFVAEGLTSEIWFYERTVTGPTRQVPTGTREVPYVDPISGTMRMLQEPTYENELTSIVETTQLLMIAGALAEWKQSHQVLRSFN